MNKYMLLWAIGFFLSAIIIVIIPVQNPDTVAVASNRLLFGILFTGGTLIFLFLSYLLRDLKMEGWDD